MNWIKSLSFVLLVSLVYQNCSPTKFSDEEKVTPQGGCSNPNTLCLNNHKVRAVNGVLASLGQFEVEVSAGTNTNGVDAQGYIHVNIYNPLSGRKGYLKIKYVGSVLVAEIDETKTNHKWVCLDHSQPATAMVSYNGVMQPNCWSPIRVFDETQVVDVGAVGGVPVAPAYQPQDNFRFEIPTVTDNMAMQVSQGCRCQFTNSWISQLTSQGFFTNILPSTWLRVSASPSVCPGIPARADYGVNIKQCQVGLVP